MERVASQEKRPHHRAQRRLQPTEENALRESKHNTFTENICVFKHDSLYFSFLNIVTFEDHSIAPKTASANAANAKVRNRQMIGGPIIL